MDLASQVFPLWLVGQFGKGVGKGEAPRVTVGMGEHSSTQWPQFSASVLRSYQSPVALLLHSWRDWHYYGDMHATTCGCRSKNNFLQPILTFHCGVPHLGSQAYMNVLLHRSHSLASSICFLSI